MIQLAIYRNIHLTFWSDTKVTDDFTPEDKYFYLYLLTNPHTNLCGCYEISIKQISREMGYTEDSIYGLIKRFSEIHNILKYDSKNKEILLLNWNKYNWTKSAKFVNALEKEIQSIKTKEFKEYITGKLYGMDTVSFSDGYGMDTTVTVTVSDTDSITDNKKKDKIDNKDTIKRIIDYLNNKCGTRYRPTTENTIKSINARLAEGYTEDDFYIVIDKKCDEWIGTKWEKFLRPDTLFRPANFESYLNQKNGGDNQNGYRKQSGGGENSRATKKNEDYGEEFTRLFER